VCFVVDDGSLYRGFLGGKTRGLHWFGIVELERRTCRDDERVQKMAGYSNVFIVQKNVPFLLSDANFTGITTETPSEELSLFALRRQGVTVVMAMASQLRHGPEEGGDKHSNERPDGDGVAPALVF
jgi:hypothetical protein